MRQHSNLAKDTTASSRGESSGGSAAQPAIDVKSLHAKIGELTLENDS